MANSILQTEKVCFMTGYTECLELHHVFGGSGVRKLSDKYGLTVYLRRDIHERVTTPRTEYDKQLRQELWDFGREKFEEHYPDLDFIKVFGRSYRK